MIYISGPGHGGPALVANTYLEGTYSEVYPNIGQDEAGLKKLFTQFSFPGGISSHVSPQTPGSIHEGGELGYSISHAFGAVFDNPDLIVACVVGDGEAETGPLATAWHSNKFLNPVTDGVVLPILHLNGYKISNPTILARITHEELDQLLRGYGWTPFFVEGYEPEEMHQAMAATLERVVEQIQRIQHDARTQGDARPRWPMIVLKSPKGWTGPKIVDGLPNEGTFRAHQVPLSVSSTTPPEHLKQLESWLRSYKPEELFDESGRLNPELAELAPKGDRRMGANPHANGGMLLRDLRMPDFRDYAVDVPSPGAVEAGDTHVLGRFLRDVTKLNEEPRNFRIFGPDETISNRLEAVFEVTNRQWDAQTEKNDQFLAPTGGVMEVLSEHQCEGWLEGYLLTGRHGLFNSYEAFIHIVDSMFNQHAKWLKMSSGTSVAAKDRVAELPAVLHRLAAGPQRLHAPGPRLHRPRCQQEGRDRPRLPPAGRQLSAVGHGSLPAQPALCERGGCGQAPGPPMADHGRRGRALHGRAWHLAMGQQRPGRRAGRGDGLRRRRAHARDPGGRFHPPRASARSQGPGGQCRRFAETGTQLRAPARAERHELRLALHERQAHHLRFPRIPLADPPADVPPGQP